MPKNTPGPWKAGKPCDSVIADKFPDGEYSLDMRERMEREIEYYDGYLIAESIAPNNRSLIIAAPDLLAAIEELVIAADPHTNMSDVVLLDALSRARATIAKARGEEVQDASH